MRQFVRGAWNGWKRIAARIGHYQSRLILSVIYFTLVGPFAIPFRLFADPLRLKRARGEGFWLPREPAVADVDEARRQ